MRISKFGAALFFESPRKCGELPAIFQLDCDPISRIRALNFDNSSISFHFFTALCVRSNEMDVGFVSFFEFHTVLKLKDVCRDLACAKLALQFR